MQRAAGQCRNRKRTLQHKFTPTNALQSLRSRRRQEEDQSERRRLSLQIRQMHRKETRAWKTARLQRYMSTTSCWRGLKKLSESIHGKVVSQQPPPDEFAEMLRDIFAGEAEDMDQPPSLCEAPFTTQEIDEGIRRLGSNKAPDECGLVAEMLKHSNAGLREALLMLYNAVLVGGDIPESWHTTSFIMLAKKIRAKAVGDFRPIASVRLLYKLFAYMLLGRVEQRLESEQPEEQHGFRANRRLEEHLLTATLVIEKTLAANCPLWIVSLDLSKAFDRVSWPALWKALHHFGESDHLIWTLHRLYRDQEGQVLGDWGKSQAFPIKAGVRQGCVLSPVLFAAVLEWAMRSWRARVANLGFDFGDGMKPLIDLRFADGILLFAKTPDEAKLLLDALVDELAKVGLILNAAKTVVMTTQAQPPRHILTRTGAAIQVLPRDAAHKWLGCMLAVGGSGTHHLDVDYHLAAANKAFFANRAMLCDRNVSLTARLGFFGRVVTSVACFGAGVWKPYSDSMHKVDVEFRRLLRQVVGPPAGVDWSQPWH